MQTERQQLGTWGETHVFALLREGGVNPYFSQKGTGLGDLHFWKGDKLVSIEVKTAKFSTKYKRYRVCLEKSGHTSAKTADFTIVLLVSRIELVTYLAISKSQLCGVKHLTIGENVTSSKWFKFVVRKGELSKCVIATHATRR